LIFTQKHAEIIARKLGCVFREGKAHKYAELFEGGKLITRFGIRRGSKEIPHYHLPRELHLKQNECTRLYDCALTKDSYLELLRQKGYL
jgi:hypothetical protein